MGQSNEQTGFLRDADKKWLSDENEYKSQSSESHRKQLIRKRLRSAMDDFVFLMDHWDQDQLDKCFSEYEKSGDAVERVRNMIALSYMGLSQINADLNNPHAVAYDALKFHRAARQGIRDGKIELGNSPETILLVSNVPLWELPDNEEFGEKIDYDDAGKKNKKYRSIEDDPEYTIAKEFADVDYRVDASYEIGKLLHSRRKEAGFDLLDFSHLNR